VKLLKYPPAPASSDLKEQQPQNIFHVKWDTNTVLRMTNKSYKSIKKKQKCKKKRKNIEKSYSKITAKQNPKIQIWDSY
jgi:hypothetical protein